MFPALNIGRAIGTLSVANWHVGDFKIEFGRAKQKVEVTKWIKIAEISAMRVNQLIILFP